MFTRLKLANLDKKIVDAMFASYWYKEHKETSLKELNLKTIIRTEGWVLLMEDFVNIAHNNKKYKNIFDQYGLSKSDVLDIMLLMTIATMPNPVIKTGSSKLSYSHVATAMFQEIDKQMLRCFETLGSSTNEKEKEMFGHKYAPDVMAFAMDLKFAHVMANGEYAL